MLRKKISELEIEAFRLMCLNSDKQIIKEKLKISEKTYQRIKAQFDKLSDEEKINMLVTMFHPGG